MFRDDVAAHYRARGYRVREGVQVRGPDGQVHACDLVVEGPLGNLVVSLDEGDGLNLPSLRRKAKELGATPVLAAPTLKPEVRQAALHAGAVVLEADDLQRPPPPPPAAPPPPRVPWPDVREPPRPDPAPAWPDHATRPRVVQEGPLVARDVDALVAALAPPEAPPAAAPPHTGDAPFWRQRPAPAPPAPSPPSALPPRAVERFAWLRQKPVPAAPAAPAATGRPKPGEVVLAPPLFPDVLDEPAAVPAALPPPPEPSPEASPAVRLSVQERVDRLRFVPTRAPPASWDAEVPPPRPPPAPVAVVAPRHAPARDALVTAARAAQAAVGGAVAGAVLFALAWLLL